MPPLLMFLVIGFILVCIGYLILFTVPSDATVERVYMQALAGMAISMIGGVFLMIYIYKKSK